jgi:hypothetical protein
MALAKLILLLLAGTGGFVPVSDRFPAPVESPRVAYDIYDNHWKLDRDGALLVQPAQNPSAWVLVHRGPWKFLRLDEYGYLWAATANVIQRFDPRSPALGWEDFSDALAGQQIAALGNAPSGAVLVATDAGTLIELDRTDKRSVVVTDAPSGITRLFTDGEGQIWLEAKSRVYRKAAPSDAWQRTWELVARLPGANHDLSGEAIGTKFYMAGGQTATWGYPAVPHVFDGLYEFDEPARTSGVAARLLHPRFYNGTAALDGKIWVIAGNVRDAKGDAHPLATVEICDPVTGQVKQGPELPYPIEMPLAVHLGRRIFVAGNEKLLSIAPGETHWRQEPGIPPTAGLKALAGTAWDNCFFVTIAKLGLAQFDGAWTVLSREYQPRSPQVAAFRNAIWVMGGRETANDHTTMIFDLTSHQWTRGPDLPRDLAWGAAAVVNGRLLVTGGAAGRCYNNRTFLLR